MTSIDQSEVCIEVTRQALTNKRPVLPEVLLDGLLGPGLAPRQLGYQLLLTDVLVITSETD